MKLFEKEKGKKLMRSFRFSFNVNTILVFVLALLSKYVLPESNIRFMHPTFLMSLSFYMFAFLAIFEFFYRYRVVGINKVYKMYYYFGIASIFLGACCGVSNEPLFGIDAWLTRPIGLYTIGAGGIAISLIIDIVMALKNRK